ncbi:uncharacterized protein [Rutidosis leptorrhynchoides]|uniref:uncharacterized protein n=1 Tax=Rutidosis leptorrhynchoides TaxID=125765 RepID=UPI003A995E1B
MASKKKESEGISLLSMYGDDEDDDDDMEQKEEDVDYYYGHDEMAVSPKAEEGEILATGQAIFGSELQSVDGTGTGAVRLLTPSTQSTPRQSSEHADQSQPDSLEYNKGNESESAHPEPINTTEDDVHYEIDPLDNFLPPPTTIKCSDELQEKIIKFILLKKKTGRSFNSEVRNRKDYRNPREGRELLLSLFLILLN